MTLNFKQRLSFALHKLHILICHCTFISLTNTAINNGNNDKPNDDVLANDDVLHIFCTVYYINDCENSFTFEAQFF